MFVSFHQCCCCCYFLVSQVWLSKCLKVKRTYPRLLNTILAWPSTVHGTFIYRKKFKNKKNNLAKTNKISVTCLPFDTTNKPQLTLFHSMYPILSGWVNMIWRITDLERCHKVCIVLYFIWEPSNNDCLIIHSYFYFAGVLTQ